MFMVGSFASGLSEGLESGWKLGKDIRQYQQRADAIRAANKEKAAKDGGGLPPLIDVGAKAPSPLEADPTGTGTSGGAEYHPDHEAGNKPYNPAAAQPALTPPGDPNAEFQYGGATPKPAAGFQPEVLTRPPQPATSAALPTAAPEELAPPLVAQPDAKMQLPGRGNYAPVPAGPAVPAPTMPVKEWWNRTFGAPPIGGALIGGGRGRDRPAPSYSPSPVIPPGPPTALGGRGNYDPTAPGRSGSPPTSGWLPPPTNPVPPVQIDPRTGQPVVRQAIPFTVAPY